jgi:uncharacterized phiE125 gp8 family phage protein
MHGTGNLVLGTAPAQEPLSVNEFREDHRIDNEDENSFIKRRIRAARLWVENHTSRSLFTTTWKLYFDSFPVWFSLPRPPLASVTSIKYIDTGGNEQTLDSGVYTVDTNREPGRVVLAFGQSWPSTRAVINAVVVEYVAGWDDVEDIPQNISDAVMLMTAHYYENREPVVVGTIVSKIPDSVRSLLASDRFGGGVK